MRTILLHRVDERCVGIRLGGGVVIGAEDFREHILANPTNAEILRRLPELNLQDCYLAAGCLFQTVWNVLSGRAPTAGIRDYDIFYFDAADTTAEAEDSVNFRARELFQDLGVLAEVKNQARVHLWYEEYFGSSYPELDSTQDGIRRFLVTCTCVGIHAPTGQIFSPNGFEDLWRGTLCINPLHARRPDLFLRKAQSYRRRWPWLQIVSPGQ